MSKPRAHPDLLSEMEGTPFDAIDDEQIQDLHRAVDTFHNKARKDIQAGTANAYGTLRALEEQMPDVNTLQ